MSYNLERIALRFKHHYQDYLLYSVTGETEEEAQSRELADVCARNIIENAPANFDKSKYQAWLDTRTFQLPRKKQIEPQNRNHESEKVSGVNDLQVDFVVNPDVRSERVYSGFIPFVNPSATPIDNQLLYIMMGYLEPGSTSSPEEQETFASLEENNRFQSFQQERIHKEKRKFHALIKEAMHEESSVPSLDPIDFETFSALLDQCDDETFDRISNDFDENAFPETGSILKELLDIRAIPKNINLFKKEHLKSHLDKAREIIQRLKNPEKIRQIEDQLNQTIESYVMETLIQNLEEDLEYSSVEKLQNLLRLVGLITTEEKRLNLNKQIEETLKNAIDGFSQAKRWKETAIAAHLFPLLKDKQDTFNKFDLDTRLEETAERLFLLRGVDFARDHILLMQAPKQEENLIKLFDWLIPNPPKHLPFKDPSHDAFTIIRQIYNVNVTDRFIKMINVLPAEPELYIKILKEVNNHAHLIFTKSTEQVRNLVFIQMMEKFTEILDTKEGRSLAVIFAQKNPNQQQRVAILSKILDHLPPNDPLFPKIFALVKEISQDKPNSMDRLILPLLRKLPDGFSDAQGVWEIMMGMTHLKGLAHEIFIKTFPPQLEYYRLILKEYVDLFEVFIVDDMLKKLSLDTERDRSFALTLSEFCCQSSSKRAIFREIMNEFPSDCSSDPEFESEKQFLLQHILSQLDFKQKEDRDFLSTLTYRFPSIKKYWKK